MKTFMPKEADVEREWLVVDAADKPAGRLVVVIADALRGRDKPTYTPHVDTGDFVVVDNTRTLHGRRAFEDTNREVYLRMVRNVPF